jgi:hypothetical protein
VVDFRVVEVVTPNEIAGTLGVTGLTFRNWLRAEKAARHPLLAAHEYRTRYRFTREEAHQLIAEYRASGGRGRARPAGRPTQRGPAEGSRASAPSRKVAATTERKPVPDPTTGALPQPPASFTRADLEAAGFAGWQTWSELRTADFSAVPCRPGAYLVFRPSDSSPSFVHPSRAGLFKGQDPSVPQEHLQREWVDGANVVYIGKADFRKRRKEVEALRLRLSEFAAFGAGEPHAHWGGRLIWQLADANELLVAWHEVTWAETARDYEKRLLSRFVEVHDGRRPFANLTG